jgi:PAS domain S-box-containing protein
MPDMMHLEASPSESTAHILLVDDQPAEVLALRAILEPLGHKLTEAASGEEALRLTEPDYAVILLDVHGLVGFETVKLIRGREKARHTPIIFLITQETDRLVIEEAYALGGVDFLVKPLVPVLLKAKVAALIDLFEKTEQVKRQAEELQVERGEFERRLTEESIRNAAIVETALECIVTIDHQGKIIQFNPAAEATFGFSRAEAVGQQMAELIIPPSLRDRHYRGVAHYLATGEGPVLGKRIEMPALRADGTEFPVELAITRIPTNGAPAFTAYIRDITERKRTERRRNVRLAVTQVLAHENTIHEAATSILQVVCESLRWDVGAFWVVDRNAQTLRCQETWHTPGVQVAWFENRSRQLTFLPGVGLPGRVWECGKPVWIPDIKGNANFSRGPVALQEGLHAAFGFPILLGKEVLGVVEFVSHEVREPDDALLKMVDTIGGQIGLFMEEKRAEEQLRRQNEELAAATRRKDAFLAMLAHELRNPLAPIRNGLQIMRSPAADQQMIEQVQSMMERQIGHLTRIVHDLLDVSRVETEPAARSEMPTAPCNTGKRLRILVVEDDRDCAESLRTLLELCGYEVTVAYSGTEGVRAAEERKPDVVLCDIGLPGLDGYGVASRLRRNPATAKARIIAVTGYGSESDRRRTQEAGFDRHMVKPVDPHELEQVLAALK